MRRLCTSLGLIAAVAGAAQIAGAGPDVTFCQLYGVQQYGQVGSVAAFAGATTSWNKDGDQPLQWFGSPDSRHPFIAQNMYMLKDDRFQQVGQSWLKNGFFALDSSQCTTSCSATGGTSLGLGCTDTYSAGLNAAQSGNNGNSARFEIDPWTGHWDYTTSIIFAGGLSDNAITRRLQVLDSDLSASGATYYYESYYLHRDDEDHMSSAAWVVGNVSGSSGNWNVSTPSSGVQPNIGWAIDAWSGATQTVIAQEVPVVENSSPDGRCVLAAKAINLGGGNWRYEYALLNVDMAAQVSSFSLPIPAGANVSNAGMRAARHHNEPTNVMGGTPIDNAAWTFATHDDAISWSTTTNPLRWGTLNNFWFECDSAPGNAVAELGQFIDKGPDYLSGLTVAPEGPFDADLLDTPDAFAAGDVTVQVQSTDGSESPTSGSLEYTISGPGGSSGSVALADLGGGLWEGTVPGLVCGQSISYHAEFTGNGGSTIAFPHRGAGLAHSARIGTYAQVFADDFSSDLGWTTDFNATDSATTGQWERAAAVYTTSQPDRDKTGDSMVLITGRANTYGESSGSNDVDDGITTITSPSFDLSGVDEARVDYWRWFNNSRGGTPAEDDFEVQVSNDDGANWSTGELLVGNGPFRYGDWFEGGFDIGISLTSQMRVRFVALDTGGGSVVDAAIDDFRVTTYTCTNPVGSCDGDANGDNTVDVNDISYVLFRLGNSGFPGSVDGDVNTTGTVDVNDISYVLFRLGPC